MILDAAKSIAAATAALIKAASEAQEIMIKTLTKPLKIPLKRAQVSGKSNHHLDRNIQISTECSRSNSLYLPSMYTASNKSVKKASPAVVSLCYCIPEFHHLTMDTLPDASSLIRQLKEAVDVSQPKTRHDQQSRGTCSPRLTKLMLQSTHSSTHNENQPAAIATKETKTLARASSSLRE